MTNLSRVEDILQSLIDKEKYSEIPLSRVENLILELAGVIEDDIKSIETITPRGSVENYSDLPTDAEVGDMYNVENADEEHGISAGDNVVYVESADGTKFWDNFHGIIAVPVTSVNGEIGDVVIPDEIFIAYYGASTYDEISNAYTEDKHIILRGVFPDLGDNEVTISNCVLMGDIFYFIATGDFLNEGQTTAIVVTCYGGEEEGIEPWSMTTQILANQGDVPTSTSQLENDSDFITLKDVPNEIFIAEYNSTSYDDVVEAYKAGKTILCKRSSKQEPYSGIFIIQNDYYALYGDAITEMTSMGTTTYTFYFRRINLGANSGTFSLETTLNLKNSGWSIDYAYGAGYGYPSPRLECGTLGSVATKVVTDAKLGTPYLGMRITVRFSSGNTAANPMLQVNDSTPRPIYLGNDPIAKNYIVAGGLYDFVYDRIVYSGTDPCWRMTSYSVGAVTAPLMDGAAAVGTELTWARADHVHPTDTSRAPLASPAFSGTPTAPTATDGTNTTQIATTAFVNSAVNAALGNVEELLAMI